MTDEMILSLYMAATLGNQAAWGELHDGLDYQVKGWVVRAGAVNLCQVNRMIDLEDLTLEAWRRFWLAARRQLSFGSGAAVMAYLKTCAQSTIADARRAAVCRVKYESLEEEHGDVAVSSDPAKLILFEMMLDDLDIDDRATLHQCIRGVPVVDCVGALSASGIYQRRQRLRQKLESLMYS